MNLIVEYLLHTKLKLASRNKVNKTLRTLFIAVEALQKSSKDMQVHPSKTTNR